MREPQGMPGIHWVFWALERGAPKEPRLPAGARALFFAIRGPGEFFGLGCPTTVRNRVVSRSPGFGQISLQPHPAFALHPLFEDTLNRLGPPANSGFSAAISKRPCSQRPLYAFVTQAFHVVRQAMVRWS